MASTTVKSTYALDTDTVRRLDRLARRWRVSKSEALRRAIRAASGRPDVPADDALEALGRLQQSLRLSPARARAWAQRAKAERRASSDRTAARHR